MQSVFATLYFKSTYQPRALTLFSFFSWCLRCLGIAMSSKYRHEKNVVFRVFFLWESEDLFWTSRGKGSIFWSNFHGWRDQFHLQRSRWFIHSLDFVGFKILLYAYVLQPPHQSVDSVALWDQLNSLNRINKRECCTVCHWI